MFVYGKKYEKYFIFLHVFMTVHFTNYFFVVEELLKPHRCLSHPKLWDENQGVYSRILRYLLP